MTTLDLTQVPNNVTIELQGNTGLFPSPLIASAQTVDRGGLKWALAYTYSSLRGANRGDMLGTLAGLRGQSNRLRVPVYDNPKRGSYGGTPLVAGGSQTGYSLDIDGCSFSIATWIAKGDYFSVIVNGEPELKMATADAASDGSGEATLAFVPKLRASPSDNAIIYVDDGVLSRPKGIFLLSDSKVSWSSRPGSPSKITAVSLSMVEDVFATQS